MFADDVQRLLTCDAVSIANSVLPDSPGVYMFLLEGDIRYVGEARGSGGLRDRVQRKHLSGDESHVLQRTFKARFPDRVERREFIKHFIDVKWVVIDDPERVAIIERLVIWLFQPEWNVR